MATKRKRKKIAHPFEKKHMPQINGQNISLGSLRVHVRIVPWNRTSFLGNFFLFLENYEWLSVTPAEMCYALCVLWLICLREMVRAAEDLAKRVLRALVASPVVSDSIELVNWLVQATGSACELPPAQCDDALQSSVRFLLPSFFYI